MTMPQYTSAIDDDDDDGKRWRKKRRLALGTRAVRVQLRASGGDGVTRVGMIIKAFMHERTVAGNQ